MINPVDQFFNWIKYRAIPWYTALGLTKGTVTLEIVGRKSGKPIRVSVTTVRKEGVRYVVSLDAKSQWVANLRAAGGKAYMLSGGRKAVRLVEIPVEERAPILLGYVSQRAFSHSGASSSRLFFDLDPNPTLEQMQAVADRYPVFCVEPG